MLRTSHDPGVLANKQHYGPMWTSRANQANPSTGWTHHKLFSGFGGEREMDQKSEPFPHSVLSRIRQEHGRHAPEEGKVVQ